jgi:hypothetical protein
LPPGFVVTAAAYLHALDDAESLGRAVEALAHSPHRSWTVGVTALTVSRRGRDGDAHVPLDGLTVTLE